MRDGTCSGCGSDEVSTKSGGVGPLVVHRGGWHNQMKIDALICAVCGAVELYVPEDKRSALRETFARDGWTRVTKPLRRS